MSVWEGDSVYRRGLKSLFLELMVRKLQDIQISVESLENCLIASIADVLVNMGVD